MKDAHRLLRVVKVLLMVMYAATVMALLANVALGQLVGRPDRGYKAGNSYSVSDIENVNLSGGNVTLNIPLASLPAGRGDASGYSISLRYDSKLWDAQQEWNDDGLDEFNDPANYTRDLLQLSSEGGWKLDYAGYQLKVVDRLESGRREDCHLHNTNYNKNSYRFKVEMKMPGGGTIAFRPSGYTDFFNDGFFEVNLNGYIYGDHYAVNIEGEPACQSNYHQSTTAGMTYYSTDGSGIRLFVPYYSTGTKDWAMYFPDGRVVEYLPADDTSIFQRVTDRNGNRTVVKSGTYDGLSGTKIEDSTGRFIFLTGTSEGTKIYQFGPAGEPLETTITWKEYFVFREYKPVAVSTMYIPPAKRLAYVVESFQMVDEVILPEEAGSLKYEFTYHADETEPDYPNNDYTNGWGELASVKVPSGAIAEYKYDLPVNENVLTVGMDVIENSITQKDLKYDETYDGATTPATHTWLYSIGSGSATVTAPDGGVTTQSSYHKTPSLKGSAFYWITGLVYGTMRVAVGHCELPALCPVASCQALRR
jgi:hypothetical protein